MRLIDLDELKKFPIRADNYDKEHGNENFVMCIEAVLEYAENLPTIDAEPVKRGRWIDKGDYAVCTECGGKSGTQYDGVEPIPLKTQFCSNCGARMEGDSE